MFIFLNYFLLAILQLHVEQLNAAILENDVSARLQLKSI